MQRIPGHHQDVGYLASFQCAQALFQTANVCGVAGGCNDIVHPGVYYLSEGSWSGSHGQKQAYLARGRW